VSQQQDSCTKSRVSRPVNCVDHGAYVAFSGNKTDKRP
jgi:hypothetical protein